MEDKFCKPVEIFVVAQEKRTGKLAHSAATFKLMEPRL